MTRARFVLLVLALAVVASPALAQDARAEAGAKQALSSAEADFLAMDYDKAVAALQKALNACAAGRCANTTRALLLRDIGTMQFRAGKKDQATKSFEKALDLDPNIALNPSYEAPDLRAAWRAVKGDGETPAPQPAPKPEPEPEPEAPAGPRAFARVWLGVAGDVDLALMKSGADVCKLDPATSKPAGDAAFYCTNGDGSDFPTRANRAENDTLGAGNGGAVDGGFQRGPVRVLVSLDYAVSQNLLLGGRVGFVSQAYDGSAASTDGRAWSIPLHLEARVTYLFGDEPLNAPGLTPTLLASTGVAPFDASKRLSVRQRGITGDRTVVAWQLSGPVFAMVGAGMRMALSPRAGFTTLAKAGAAFGAQGVLFVVSPELAFQVGF